MILYCTIPSLSGTFGIPAWLAHSPKMPKESSSPSRSDAQAMRQCVNEWIADELNQGQRTTLKYRFRPKPNMYFLLN